MRVTFDSVQENHGGVPGVNIIHDASNLLPCESFVGGEVEGLVLMYNFGDLEKPGHQYRIPGIDSDHVSLLLDADGVLSPERYTAGRLRERRVDCFGRYVFDVHALRWTEDYCST